MQKKMTANQVYKRYENTQNNTWRENKKGIKEKACSVLTVDNVISVTGNALKFNENNFNWSMLNIFRTRFCDRLNINGSCHMINRCLFSHDINWLRRTPFLPKSTYLTLRYIPVWCPRIGWPNYEGFCNTNGRITWTELTEKSMMSNLNTSFDSSLCPRNENCPFVHSLDEYLYHPEIYKTRKCCFCLGMNELGSASMCPWYFCPFAHTNDELRIIFDKKKFEEPITWYPPPQMVDNFYIAHTQNFNERELFIIRKFKQRYINGFNVESTFVHNFLFKPILRILNGNPIDQMVTLSQHKSVYYDEQCCMMIQAAIASLRLYPVENYYIPNIISIQCSILEKKIDEKGYKKLTCGEIINIYSEKYLQHNKAQPDEQLTPSVVSEKHSSAFDCQDSDLNAILDILESKGVFKVMDLLNERSA